MEYTTASKYEERQPVSTYASEGGTRKTLNPRHFATERGEDRACVPKVQIFYGGKHSDANNERVNIQSLKCSILPRVRMLTQV